MNNVVIEHGEIKPTATHHLREWDYVGVGRKRGGCVLREHRARKTMADAVTRTRWRVEKVTPFVFVLTDKDRREVVGDVEVPACRVVDAAVLRCEGCEHDGRWRSSPRFRERHPERCRHIQLVLALIAAKVFDGPDDDGDDDTADFPVTVPSGDQEAYDRAFGGPETVRGHWWNEPGEPVRVTADDVADLFPSLELAK